MVWEVFINRLILLVLLCLLFCSSSLFYSYHDHENIAQDGLRKSSPYFLSIPSKTIVHDRDETPAPIADLYLGEAPALSLYRESETRQAVVDFFISLAGSEEVALHTIYYSNKFEISFLTSFSIAYVESRFLPTAENHNSNLSVDRGVFQLNSNSFPHLQVNDFWNPEISARYGLSYFQWCLEQSSNTEMALAMYNAGYGRVKRGIIPPSTQVYIEKILRVKEQMRQELYEYLLEVVPDSIVRLASL